MTSDSTNLRHVCGISGGKDSAALSIYMRDRVPNMEYFFCDTQKELPETYDFLARLEGYLGKPIARLNDERGFDHWLKVYGGYLPSSQMRWCTRQLKIKPFEKWVGDDNVISYVGIRADENRSGYVSTKPNIRAVFPFVEDGLIKEDIMRILEESGVGLPKYYEWRSRSGCYFCFYQRKIEWVGLRERHPDLYEKAMSYEKGSSEDASAFTWTQSESLAELAEPARVAEIRAKHEASASGAARMQANRRLVEVFAELGDSDGGERPCMQCHI
ncbi:MAG: phosphoadenosine phosphosulfate reductase family protein [Myxococcales bacterium]|nr:phosphoadenosine phosphosulfate reductase family protein [Myxococcales bacterium]